MGNWVSKGVNWLRGGEGPNFVDEGRRPKARPITARPDITAAKTEEERLRKEALKLMLESEGRIRGEGETIEGRLRGEHGRAFAGAVGRRAGRASGGGALSALSGVQTDLSRQAAEARAGIAERLDQAKANRIQFQRETMKSSEQLSADASAVSSEVDSLQDKHTRWGRLNKGKYRQAVGKYLASQGIEPGTAQYKAATDQMEQNIRDAWWTD